MMITVAIDWKNVLAQGEGAEIVPMAISRIPAGGEAVMVSNDSPYVQIARPAGRTHAVDVRFQNRGVRPSENGIAWGNNIVSENSPVVKIAALSVGTQGAVDRRGDLFCENRPVILKTDPSDNLIPREE